MTNDMIEKREAAAQWVADRALNLKHLAPRLSDDLDFHSLYCGDIQNALEMAYDQGREDERNRLAEIRRSA